MMDFLRKYMKQIFLVVMVAFIATIIFSWGMGGFKDKGSGVEQGIIGVVNGQKIQFQQFAMAVDQQVNMAREQAGEQELSEYRIKAIRDRVWEEMVQNILYGEEIKRQNIVATPEEIVFQLRNNPPEFLRQNEQFLTDGQFDMTKYQQALSDPRNYDAWIPIENFLRSSLPMNKLQQYILATVRVTDDELLHAYKLENEKVNAKYIYFNPALVPMESIDVTDEEIEKYYNENQEEFFEPEMRAIQYASMRNQPSANDSSQSLQDALDAIKRINQGTDFADMAQESDDEGTRENGGDLGFFGKGQMVKPFEDAAFSAKIRDIVGPVLTQHGYHVIQVLARKYEDGETKVQARHILYKVKISPETYDHIQEKAQYLYEEAQEAGRDEFMQLAEAEGMDYRETQPFEQGNFIPGLGMSSRITYYTYAEKLGYVGRPTTAGDKIVIYRVSEIKKPRTKPLDDVKSSIKVTLQKEKQKAKAGEQCQLAWQKISGGTDIETVAAQDSLEFHETGLFGLQAYVTRIGREVPFSGAAFKLNVGELSGPIEAERGFYILQVIDKQDIDESNFENEKEAQRQRVMQMKQNQIYMAWMNRLKENADIVDYRDQYF